MKAILPHKTEMEIRKLWRNARKASRRFVDDSRYPGEALRTIRATSHNFRGELRR